jgi:hypothetical protein
MTTRERLEREFQILIRYMKSEIDAATTLSQLKAGGSASTGSDALEYILWPDSMFPPGHVEKKTAELRAIMQGES